ncbi:MAG: multicopper oxidase family protein [Acidimicrobiales bacterium]
MTPTEPIQEPRRRRFPRLRRRWARRLLILGAAASIVIVGVLAVGAWMYTQARIDTTGDISFDQPLHIPPLLEPETDSTGRAVFDLQLQQGPAELLPGTETVTWGANGNYLGPTLRASRGDDIAINVTNSLPESTTLHWHGMHLPAVADGGPHQMIPPGESWSPTWTIDQPAATLWYHPHPHGETADHVYRGVAGLFLLDDDQDVELPDDYGIDDIPIILQDKRFNDDGSLDLGAHFLSTVGQLGDEILVNGTHRPHLDVETDLVRLRVLNASNGRVYNLGFDDDRSFELIGTDGGLLEQPVSLRRLQVSPGERAEIVVRVDPGERTVLRSNSPELGLNFLQRRFSGGDDRFDLLELRAADTLAESPPVPRQLTATELPDPADADTTRTFELTGRSRINGQKMDMSRIDTIVAVDTTEIWEVTNRSGNPHNFHIHDVQFRVLDLDSDPPPAHLDGPKDTVFIPPGSTVRVAVRFADYTDPDVPYMYHCHILFHEDAGMMGQFTVVESDAINQAPRQTPNDPSHEHDD